jgi:hypothetical protein
VRHAAIVVWILVWLVVVVLGTRPASADEDRTSPAVVGHVRRAQLTSKGDAVTGRTATAAGSRSRARARAAS